jgi:hypothetical protein
MQVVIGSRLGTDIEWSISGTDLDPISVGMDIECSILGMVCARKLLGMDRATRIRPHTQRARARYAGACTCTFLRMCACGSRMRVNGRHVCTHTHAHPVRKWLRRSSFLGKNFRFFPLTFTKKFLVGNTQGAAVAAKET